jgi:hypothetical protein
MGLALGNTDSVTSVVVTDEVDGQDTIARIVVERERQRNAATTLASMSYQSRKQDLSCLRLKVAASTLREGADIAIAIHLLSRASRTTASVGESRIQDVLHSSLATKEAALAVDSKGSRVKLGDIHRSSGG